MVFKRSRNFDLIRPVQTLAEKASASLASLDSSSISQMLANLELTALTQEKDYWTIASQPAVDGLPSTLGFA